MCLRVICLVCILLKKINLCHPDSSVQFNLRADFWPMWTITWIAVLHNFPHGGLNINATISRFIKRFVKLLSFYTSIWTPTKVCDIRKKLNILKYLSMTKYSNTNKKSVVILWPYIVKQQIQCADESTIAFFHWDCSCWPLVKEDKTLYYSTKINSIDAHINHCFFYLIHFLISIFDLNMNTDGLKFV